MNLNVTFAFYMSQMISKKFLHNTTFSFQLTYTAGAADVILSEEGLHHGARNILSNNRPFSNLKSFNSDNFL